MKTEYITYNKLPIELLAIKNKAFAHSILTEECEAMDALGNYTALYIDNRFIGAVNTITNAKPIELWSKNEAQIEGAYSFFCRGFVGEDIPRGTGTAILTSLSLFKTLKATTEKNYTSVRSVNKGMIRFLSTCGFEIHNNFTSYHNEEEVVDLSLLKYQFNKTRINAKQAELISHIQQSI